MQAPGSEVEKHWDGQEGENQVCSERGFTHTSKAVPRSQAGEVLLEALGCGQLAKPWSSSLCEGKMGKEQLLFPLPGVTMALTGDFAIEQVFLPASLTCTLVSGLCLNGATTVDVGVGTQEFHGFQSE